MGQEKLSREVGWVVTWLDADGITRHVLSRHRSRAKALEAARVARKEDRREGIDTQIRCVRAMTETQRSISRWAEKTFGSSGSNASVAARANKEMAELLRALTANDKSHDAASEIADVVIVLYRLATRLGVNVQKEIDRKMLTNRLRVWKRDGSGHGYHLRFKP